MEKSHAQHTDFNEVTTQKQLKSASDRTHTVIYMARYVIFLFMDYSIEKINQNYSIALKMKEMKHESYKLQITIQI